MARRHWAFVAVVAAFAAAGCAYSTRSSGLPGHIKTVHIPVIRNPKQFYVGLETRLTRRIIELVNQDPNVRVVNDGGDATILGEITNVTKTVTRETKEDQPATVRIAITLRLTFIDEVEQHSLVDGAEISSSQSSSQAGLYEVDRGEVRTAAEDDAVEALAKEVVRRTLGMW